MKHPFKRIVALLLAVVMVLGVMPSVFAANVEPFKDVQDNAWYAPYVKAVYEAGLMQGVKADRFDPEGTSTRAQVVTVLYRIAGQPPVGGPATFTDLVADWYANPVAWAQKEGVVNGKTTTEFGPDDNVTREQLVTMIHRYYGEPAGTGDLNTFSDAAKVSGYAKNAFAWAIGAGVINGSNGKLDPLGEATRAQFAKIIWTAKLATTCEHVWNDGVITKEATCGAAGVKTYTCTVCNKETKTEVIPATGAHTWNEGETTTAPTCAAEGVKTYTCTVCGKTKTETIPATGEHNYVNGVCTVCGAQQDAIVYTRTETLNEGDEVIIVAAAKNMALSGEYNGFYNAATAVTPNGNELATFDTTIVWTVGKEGDYYTFSYNGQKIGMADSYSSMPLGEKNYTWQVLPAKTEGAFYLFNVGRQVYAEYYETNSNWSGYYNNSNEELFALHFYVRGNDCDHAWNEGEVTTPATCEEAGVKTYTCSTCGATKTETIEATGHNAVDGVCTICGKNVGGGEVYNLTSTLNDGDQVVIVAAAKNMALSATYSGFYNSAVAVTPVDGKLTNPAEDLIWTVGKDGDTYTFSYNGQKIGMADSYSSMPLGEKNDTWQVLPALTEGAFYIFNIGREVYMEYYETNGNWSGYYNNSNEELFALNFYVKGEAPCDHAWNEGEVTTPATCEEAGVKTFTCTICGETKTEAVEATGHNAVDGVCTICGKNVGGGEVYNLTSTLNDGDQVVIVAAAKNMALSATYSGFYNSAVAVTPVDGKLTNPAEDLIWTVGKDGDTYTFSYNGQKLGMADSYSSMPLGEKNDTWQVLPALTEGAFYIFNIGREVYVEYYEKNGNWSGYYNNSDEALFALNFYVKGEAPCDHAWDDGVVTTEPTCTNPGVKTFTCTICGETKEEAIMATGNHTYVDGVCTECGDGTAIVTYALSSELKDGDQVVIVAAAKNMALSATYSGFYNSAVAVTPVDGILENPAEDLVWTVGKDGDTYTFSYNGQKIGMADSYSSMPLGEKHNTWQVLPAMTEGAFYIFNIGREVYVEYYEKNGNWSGYYNNSDEALFALNFYVKGETPDCQHLWNEGEVVKEATCVETGEITYTCTKCGETKVEYTAPTGEHTYDNGACTQCGKEEPKPEVYVLTNNLKTGDEVIIFNPGNGKALSTIKNVYYLNGVDMTPVDNKLENSDTDIVWTVRVNEDGTYSFINGGKELSVDSSVSNNKTYINIYAENGHKANWNLETCNVDTNTFYVTNLQVEAKFEKIYLEWYAVKNGFSAYDTSADKATELDFGFQFYAKDAAAPCQHAWDQGEITTEPTCIKVGVKTYTCTLCGATKLESVPTADVHNYENGVCTDCGESQAIIAPVGYVAIYNVAHNVVMTTESSVYNNKEQFGAAAATLTDDKLTTEANNVALFKMTTDENGMVTFTTPDGKFLEADGTNIRFADVEGENTLFVLEETEGGYYVRLANAIAFNKAQYIEYYTSANVFTVYGMGKDTTMYVFDFYELADAVDPTEPSEPETEPTTAPTEPSEPETEPTTAPTEPSEPETEPTEPEELTTGKYVIAAKVGEVYYAMSNTFDKKVTGAEIVLVDGKVSAEDAAAYVVELTETEGGWIIKGANGYLSYASSTNFAVAEEAYTWVIAEGTNGTWRVTASSADTRGILFRAKDYLQFGAYAVSNAKEGSEEYFDVELLLIDGEIIEQPTEPTEPSEPETEPTEPSEPETEPTEPAEPGELTDGEYVIAAYVDGKYYAMSNVFGTKISGAEITVTDGKVAAADAANYVVTLTSTTEGWTIRGAEGYLSYVSGTNLGTSEEAYTWNITASTVTAGLWNVTSFVTPTRGLLFQLGTGYRFGGYAMTNVGKPDYVEVVLLPVV